MTATSNNIGHKPGSHPTKLAILSHILPPSPSGQSVMLGRLLDGLRPTDYCLLSHADYGSFPSDEKLPGRYYYLPMSPQPIAPAWAVFRSISRFVSAPWRFYKRVRGVAKIVSQEHCGLVLACSGDIFDIPLGYFASRLAGLPFCAYLFDDYLHQWKRTKHRYLARLVEPMVMRHAAAVIVPNEFLREELHRRHDVEAVVLHNPCSDALMDNPSDTPWPAEQDQIQIVYTGAVYSAHYDAFRNLIAAIQLLGQGGMKLHLYTAQPVQELEQQQICGPVVLHPHSAAPQVVEAQRRADILFLPLAFDSPYPQIIKTSAPGKMGEYLASGRPILVHAPANSFVSWYFKKHECGLVVDCNDPALLADAIRRVVQDAELRRRMAENARCRAQSDFDPRVIRKEFLKVIESISGH